MNKLLAALVAGFFAVGAFAQTPTPAPEAAPAPMAKVAHPHAKKMPHKAKHNVKHAKRKAHHAAKAM